MLYSQRKKFLFIHIPKTAGTSIRQVLQPYCGHSGLFNYLGRRLEFYPELCFCTGLTKRRTFNPHTTYMEVAKLIPTRELDKIYKFCFCRNPLDRMVSFYHHVLAKPQHHQHNLLMSYGSFDAMLKNLDVVREPLQCSYVVDAAEESKMDFVGRFEQIEADFRQVCGKLDIPYNLPVKNTTKHADYREAYSSTNWRRVVDYYERDFDMFGYEKKLV